jgi:uncharacterized protein YndB with AHSA1/START domain
VVHVSVFLERSHHTLVTMGFSVSATRTIPAPASAIFDLLADPRQHVRLDGSGSVTEVIAAPNRLSRGAVFSMRMRIGATYATRNVVSVFEENRAIAWHHFAHFTWRYDLEEVSGGTKVTESFTYNNPLGLVIMVLGFPERNRRAMVATLERLETAVTS